MNIIYSDHAIQRMGQRGVTLLEVEHVVHYPSRVQKSFGERKIAAGKIRNRLLQVVFIETERHIKIITVM